MFVLLFIGVLGWLLKVQDHMIFFADTVTYVTRAQSVSGVKGAIPSVPRTVMTAHAVYLGVPATLNALRTDPRCLQVYLVM
jgi:hypothetical protein